MAEGLFDYSLWGLFVASFLADTVVPFSSEALLTFLIINGTDAYAAVLVASAGNWLAGKFLRYVVSGWLTVLVF